MAIDKDFEARSKGGKNAWKNVPKKERSRILSERGKLRWKPKSAKRVKAQAK